jgi:hypothetical protein
LGNPIIIEPGQNLVEVTVIGLGGLLNAWMDFNGNSAFDAGEQIFDDVDLLPGTYVLPFTAPITPNGGAPIATRFRWGQAGLNSTGFSLFAGEVEDYLLPTAISQTGNASPLVGDFNSDLAITKADYNVWKSTFGSQTDMRADANKDGAVNMIDYTMWQDHMGQLATARANSSRLAATSSAAASSASVPVHESVSERAARLGLEVITVNTGRGTRQVLLMKTPVEVPAEITTITTANAAVVPDLALANSVSIQVATSVSTFAPPLSLATSAVIVDDEGLEAGDSEPAASATSASDLALLDYAFSELESRADESESDAFLSREDEADEEIELIDLALASGLDW